MADPTFNAADITVIDSAEATTNWSQTGSMGPNSEPDFFVQGTQSVGIELKSTGTVTLRYDRGSGSTIVGMHIRSWLWLASAVVLDLIANQGLTFRVWDSGGTNWGEWDIGGSDSAVWIGKGWKMIVVDGDRAFDRDSGTAPAKTDIQYIGIRAEIISTLSKTTGIAMDRLMISASADTSDSTGGVLEITSPSYTGGGTTDLDFVDGGGGNDSIVRTTGSWITDGFENGDTIVVTGSVSNNGEYVVNSAPTATTLTVATASLTTESDVAATVTAVFGLQDIVTKDQATDDSWYGHVSKDKNGSFELTGKLILGDISGAGNTIFRDVNQVMIWADNPVGADQYKLIIVEDSGTTEATFGTEVGSGDDSRGVDGGLMTCFEDVFSFDYSIKATDASPIFNAFGLAVTGASGGLNLAQTDVQFVGCTISSCGQIILSSGAEMREGFIVGSIEPSGVGAILLNANPTTPEFRDMQLINNLHAIESETNGPTTLDLRNIQFSGNTADIRFNHTTGLLTVNVLEDGDTPSTSDGGGGGTIEVVNAVLVKITIQDTASTPIQNARVLMLADTGGDLPALDSVTITRVTTTATVAHTAHGLSNGDQVVIDKADQEEYNGIKTISNVSANAYDYTVSGSPTTPATGSIVSSAVILNALSNASGIVQDTAFNFTSTQPVTGPVRQSSVSPFKKTGTILGSIVQTTGYDRILRLVSDE